MCQVNTLSDNGDPLYGAVIETQLAISSLNMYPEPNPGYAMPESYGPEPTEFISHIDANVSHALEHLRAALDYLGNQAQRRTYVFHVTYEGNAKQEGRIPGNLFGVECFHGTIDEARAHFIRWLIEMELIQPGMADPSCVLTYGYRDRFHMATSWLRQFGYDYHIRCPQEER